MNIEKELNLVLLLLTIKELKNLGPVTQTRNNYVMKEQKQQYIEIPYGETKNEEALEALVTNVIHGVVILKSMGGNFAG